MPSAKHGKKESSSVGDTPVPLPQGEVVEPMDMEAPSSNAATADGTMGEAAVPAHAIEAAVPGPFVVFQGIPGDGTANTIDSSPTMDYLGSTRSGSRSRSSSSDGRGSSFKSQPAEAAAPPASKEDEKMTPTESLTTSISPTSTTQTDIFVEDMELPSLTGLVSSGSTVSQSDSLNPVMALPEMASVPGLAKEAEVDFPVPSTLGFVTPPPSPFSPPPGGVNGRSRSNAAAPSLSIRQPRLDSHTVNVNFPFDRAVPDENPTLNHRQRRAAQKWEEESRSREVLQREDFLLEERQREITASAFASTRENGDGATQPRKVNQSKRLSWSHRNGHLAVLSELPSRDKEGQVIPPRIIGDLAPGCAITAVEMLTVDSETLKPIEKDSTKGSLRFLFIDSPISGYVLYSCESGYTYLGAGLPSRWAEPDTWVWRVTCPDGGFVRDGLELTDNLIEVIPYGAFVKVLKKTVNSMGLSRLRVEAILPECHEATTLDEASCNARSERTNIDYGDQSLSPRSTSFTHNVNGKKAIVGWISECLNPLSGQRGPIVQPVPFPVPIQYRVTLPEGAVIRSDVELSSNQIGHAPVGTILNVVGRSFSEHPTNQCVERLKLAGRRGWVSARLNLLSPLDELLVELVAVDSKFDPNDPGLYHLKEQAEVKSLQNNDMSDGTRYPGFSSCHGFDDDSDWEDYQVDGQTGSGSMPTPIPSKMGGCGATAGASSGQNGTCLICLTEERNATIVHGGTGHIACCLTCARILKARGDKCPVCRLSIDAVIQQFWA